MSLKKRGNYDLQNFSSKMLQIGARLEPPIMSLPRISSISEDYRVGKGGLPSLRITVSVIPTDKLLYFRSKHLFWGLTSLKMRTF